MREHQHFSTEAINNTIQYNTISLFRSSVVVTASAELSHKKRAMWQLEVGLQMHTHRRD
jgi:hypothetical protein